jgi:peptidyl-prolyl cis-trans isomerase C
VLCALFSAAGCGKDKEPTKQSKSKSAKPRKQKRFKVPPCPEEYKGKIVATVDGIKIEKCDFYNKIHKLSPYIRRRYTSLKRKKEFLDRIVRFELLAQAARRAGLDKHPDVLRAKKETMVQKLSRKMFRKAFKPSEITEAELKSFYEKHKDDYNKPAMVRVSHILVKTKEKARQLLDRAKKMNGREFRNLAKEESLDTETRMRGGDLRYFPKDTKKLPKPIVEVAFSLKKRGEMGGPVKTAKGWHIVRMSGRRRPISRDFHQVRQLLRNRVLRQKRTQAQQAFVEKLQKQTQPFEVNEEKLKLVKICKPQKTGRRFPFRRGHPQHRKGGDAGKKSKKKGAKKKAQ